MWSLIGNFFSRFTRTVQINGPRRAWGGKGSVAVNEDSSMQVAAFNRGLIYISTQIAKLPWEVKDKGNNILSGDISNLLNLAPNPEMNAFTFRLTMVQQAIIHGNSYAEIERTVSGTPLYMWPIRTQDVTPTRDAKTGRLVYRVNQGSGISLFLEPRDIFHVKNFHTKDGIIGQGVVAYGMETLGITLAADRMAAGIFNNGGVPSGVLSHPGTLSDEAYARIKKSWDEQNSGRKAGGAAILEEGTKYESINIAPDVLQFLESRQFSVLEVARFLGVPPTKLFDITAATYSNVENANLEVATDTLDSWAVNLEMEADVKLLNNRYGGRFTELDLYAVFRGDMKTRSDYFKTLMSIGAITPNQIRQREGMPGYGTQGDNYYISTNNLTPADRLDEVIDAQIASKKSPPAGNPPAKDVTPANNELETAAIAYLKKT